MKLELTLITLFSTLFINNVYALSPENFACNQAIEKGDSTGALELANKLLINNKNDKDALICQGRALTLKGDLAGALNVFKNAAAQSKDEFDKTIVNLLIGRTHKVLKQYEQAIANFQLSLSNAKVANSDAFQRVAYNAMGDVYFETNKLDEALDKYTTASKLSANDNDRAESYENIALTHHTMHHNALALEYEIKAYLMNEIAGSLDQYAHSSIELGRYYTIEKSYVSAENTLNKLIKMAKEQGGAYYEAAGSYMLAKVKVAQGDIPTAKTLIEQAKMIAKNTNDSALANEIELETKDLHL